MGDMAGWLYITILDSRYMLGKINSWTNKSKFSKIIPRIYSTVWCLLRGKLCCILRTGTNYAIPFVLNYQNRKCSLLNIFKWWASNWLYLWNKNRWRRRASSHRWSWLSQTGSSLSLESWPLSWTVTYCWTASWTEPSGWTDCSGRGRRTPP